MANLQGRVARRIRRRLGRAWRAVLAHPVPSNRYPVLREGFSIEHSNGATQARFRISGRRIAVNAPAVAVLGLCDGSRTVKEIVSDIAGELRIEPRPCRRNVKRLIRQLRRARLAGLYRWSSPPPFLALPASTALESEVEAAVRFRMGRFYDKPAGPASEPVETQGRHRRVIRFRNGKSQPDSSGGHQPIGREKLFLDQLSRLETPRGDFDIIFDGDDGPGRHPTVPIHGHFRVSGADATILWPLAGYTDIDADNFGRDVDISDRPWERKIDKAVWRGTTTGLSIANKSTKEIDALMSRPFRASDPVCGIDVPRANRLQLVRMYHGADCADVGLSGFAQIDEPARAYLRQRGFLKNRLSRRELLRHKYLIVVDGNTFASQLPWSLHCRSVVLMAPPAWESIIESVTAWEHYVPLAPDFSDLREKIEWCRSNDATCREISWRATRLMRRHYQREREHRIRQRMLDRYAENFAAP